MASPMTLNTWALSLMGSRLAKILKEKNTNIKTTGSSIELFNPDRQADSASPTEPHLSANRCSALDGR